MKTGSISFPAINNANLSYVERELHGSGNEIQPASVQEIDLPDSPAFNGSQQIRRFTIDTFPQEQVLEDEYPIFLNHSQGFPDNFLFIWRVVNLMEYQVADGRLERLILKRQLGGAGFLKNGPAPTPAASEFRTQACRE